MKKTKLTAAALLLVLIVGVFCGCADIRSIREHNAEIYNVEDMLLSTFIDEHRLGGMYYENPDYVEGVDDYKDKYYYDLDSPNFWAIIIKDREEFDKAFKENTLNIDFEHEMLLLYVGLGGGGNAEYTLDAVAVDGDKAAVYYEEKSSFPPLGYLVIPFASASAPVRTFIAVKMNKADITSVDFIEK